MKNYTEKQIKETALKYKINTSEIPKDQMKCMRSRESAYSDKNLYNKQVQ